MRRRSRKISWTVFATVTAPPWTARLAAIASGLPRRPFRSRPSTAPRCWESTRKWTIPWQPEGSGVFDSRATATEFLDRPDCDPALAAASYPVSYTHLRAHETRHDLVCRLL